VKKHYFLMAAVVVYQRESLERQKPLNVLMTSDTQTINRSQLGRAQQQAQVRFFTEFDKERKANVVDVFMQSVSYLGEMTEEEFHGEFYVDPDAPETTFELEGEPVKDAGDAEQSSEAAAEKIATADAPETEAKE
jgi:hypothetical protein